MSCKLGCVSVRQDKHRAWSDEQALGGVAAAVPAAGAGGDGARADGVRGRERPGAPPPDPRGDEGWVRGGDGEG